MCDKFDNHTIYVITLPCFSPTWQCDKADILTDMMCIERILEELSWYLDCHNGDKGNNSNNSRLVFGLDDLESKLILTIWNKFIAIPFSHNTTLCCKITTKLLSQQCSLRPLCEPEMSYRLSVLLQLLWINLKYSLVVILMTYATRAKCSAHKLTVTLLQGPLAVKWGVHAGDKFIELLCYFGFYLIY